MKTTPFDAIRIEPPPLTGTELDDLRRKLTDVCARATFSLASPRINFAGPCAPYVPEGWNETLVLAETADSGPADHGEWLRSLSPIARTQRLTLDPLQHGLPAWRAGFLPFALNAALGLEPGECALGNAVTWTVSGKAGNAETPPDLVRASARVWRQLLPLLNPSLVVTVGHRARRVMAATWSTGFATVRTLELAEPSGHNRGQFKKQLAGRDPLRDFPGIAAAAERYPQALEQDGNLKLLFAVHAIEAVGELWEHTPKYARFD